MEELMPSKCGAGEDSWEYLDSKEIKPIKPKVHQQSIFIGRTDAEPEALILWPPYAKNQLIGKDLMLGKIEGRRTLSSVKGDNRGWDGWMPMDMSLSKLW